MGIILANKKKLDDLKPEHQKLKEKLVFEKYKKDF